MKLTLAKTSNFGVVECGFWTDENNRDRLDKNSVTVKLSGTDGKLYNTYVKAKKYQPTVTILGKNYQP